MEDRNSKYRLDFNIVKEAFEMEGYELKDKNYINAFKKLNYICPNGHEHSIRWNDWQQGIRCPYCSSNISVGEKDISTFLESYFNKILYRDRDVIK
ncbi:MAG: hypothetical protein SVO01_10180, partial [Thermotogota bacterium]|nr:hypothetical protein [Thermotogota bacterium]